MDDIGTDLVSAYAESDLVDLTPNLDTLAQQGVLFRNAWAGPMCSATRAAIMTSRYAFRTGIGGAWAKLQPEHPTLPQFLGSSPSLMVGKWHTTTFSIDYSGVVSGYSPLDTGFSQFRGTRYNFYLGVPLVPPHFFTWEKWIETATGGAVIPMSTYATSEEVDDVLAWTAQQTEPWFVMLSFHAAHTPDMAPPEDLHTNDWVKSNFSPGEYFEGSCVCNYEIRLAVIEAMDTEIGRLLAGIDLEQTTVLVMGDNGSQTLNPTAANRGTKSSIWEGGINVPFIAAGAGVEVGAESAALVHAVDLFPTVLELMGRPAVAHQIDGESFVASLADSSIMGRDFVYTDGRFDDPAIPDTSRHDVAVRGARYKLIHRSCDAGGGYELYDLLLDPHEDVDLWGDPPDPDAALELLNSLISTARAHAVCGPCSDGLDNDGDALIDLDDPDCSDSVDPLEAPDADEDLVEDDLDNCVEVSNPSQLDADGDDFGNVCDCDFDQNFTCSIGDFSIFREDYIATVDRGVGTDMDEDGAVGVADFSLFRDGYVAGEPGPSGLVP
jgi:arylsulfatase A-like enzyme